MVAQKKKGKQIRPAGKLYPGMISSEKIAFDYIKSNYFRVISVNGVVGGITPSGDIHMGVWSQRQPYPKHVVHDVKETGERSITIGDEVGREQRPAIIREVEAGLVFNATMARALIVWLQNRLKEASDSSTESSEDEHGDHAVSDVEPTYSASDDGPTSED
jgi:hypothetical protein